MQNEPDHKEMRAFTFTYLAYVFLHLYPTYAAMGRILWTPFLGCISEKTFRRKIKTRILALGDDIHETVWDDLYHEDNVIDNNACLTGSVDGAPVFVWKPSSVRVASMLVAPKYGNKACLKFQILVTNMFRIADAHGLEIGVDHDKKMCVNSGILRRRHPIERWFGDSAYERLTSGS